MATNDLLNPVAEKKRYDKHNNYENDSGYRNFLKPVVDLVVKNESNSSAGLDYGAGPGPVISAMLNEKGYKTVLYDPFYYDNPSVLEAQYDFIICCEVMEHFYKPNQEFKRLSGLVKEGGRLYCKTLLLTKDVDFKGWWYKNDETHVFFYTPEALVFICKEFGFKSHEIINNVIVFTK